MDMFMLIGMGIAAAALVAYSLFPKTSDKVEAVERRSKGLRGEDELEKARNTAKSRSTNRVFEMAAPLLSRPVMPKNVEEQSTLRAKLASAGYRRESAATLFLASKTALGIVGCIGGALYALNADKDTTGVIGYAIFAMGGGFLLPNIWLSNTVTKRGEAIRNGLPDSLDLMVVAVEAGLGLDAAILRVSDEMRHCHGELAEELSIATVETQMGVPRGEALARMAARTPVQEMKALVAVIVQAEKLGTSIAKALRTQAEALRTKRRQRAEERAQKTAVKLLFPLVLFIFPTIFIVLAGPAAIQLMNNLGGAD